jgi:hypothetical protein
MREVVRRLAMTHLVSTSLALALAMVAASNAAAQCWTALVVANRTSDALAVELTLYESHVPLRTIPVDSLQSPTASWDSLATDTEPPPARRQINRVIPPRVALRVAVLPGCRGPLDRHHTRYGIERLALRGARGSVVYLNPDVYRAFAKVRRRFVLDYPASGKPSN